MKGSLTRKIIDHPKRRYSDDYSSYTFYDLVTRSLAGKNEYV